MTCSISCQRSSASRWSLVEGEVPAGGRRYRFLETVRHYARERLAAAGGTERFRQRHFDFFFEEFRGALPLLGGAGESPGSASAGWSRTACARRWSGRSRRRRWAGTRWNWPPRCSGTWTKRGQFSEGLQWFERALGTPVEIDPALRGRALIGLTHMYHFLGRFQESGAAVAQALPLGTAAGDAWTVCFAEFGFSMALFELGDFDESARRARAARAAAVESGNMALGGAPVMVLGDIATARGDYEGAQRLYDEAVQLGGTTGEKWGYGILKSISSALRIVRGDIERGHQEILEALSFYRELEDPRGIAWTLEVFGILCAARGQAADAARLWGASTALMNMIGGAAAADDQNGARALQRPGANGVGRCCLRKRACAGSGLANDSSDRTGTAGVARRSGGEWPARVDTVNHDREPLSGCLEASASFRRTSR